jgi:predicted nucleic acid-binding protein
MYNLAVSITLTENKKLSGEKLLPLIRDSKTGQVSVSPIILVEAETMSSIRNKLHDLVNEFIDDMIETGEFSEFADEEEED